MSVLLILPDGTKVPCRVGTLLTAAPRRYGRAWLYVEYKNHEEEEQVFAKLALLNQRGKCFVVIDNQHYDFQMPNENKIELESDNPRWLHGFKREKTIGFKITIEALIRPYGKP